MTARKGLALVVFIVLAFVLWHQTSAPSDLAAFGSARAGLRALKGHSKSSAAAADATAATVEASPSPTAAPRRPKKQIPLGDMARKPLRQRLSYFFPYEREAKFPAYVWQTWRVTPGSGDFREEFRPLEASWTEMHPGFVHEVLTDDIALNVLRHLYSGLPDVIHAYEALPKPVMKADFFRYLILLARGGIYSDIDTQALQSAIDWVPNNIPRSSYGLVIGIEADPDRDDWAEWYSRRIQFCQWTIQAKPGHPVLVEIVAKIVEKTLAMQKEGTLTSAMVNSIVEFTGPAIWTDVIFDYFNDERFFDTESAETNITWSQFTGMTESKRVGDVVVLPITGFSPGIATMGAGGDDDPMAMVKHYFDGSWKPENERHIGEQQD